MIDREKKIIFIHIPKTAGIGIVKGMEWPYSRGHYKYFSKPDQQWKLFAINEEHATLHEIGEMLGEELSDFYSFAVVRNPYDRFISLYHHLVKQKIAWWRPSFPEFVDFYFGDRIELEMDDRVNQHFKMGRPLTEWIEDGSSLDYIIRFEDLQEGFSEMRRQVGLPKRRLKKTNRSRRSKTRDYYTPELQDIIAEKYHDDFKLFGYAFDLP